MYTTFVPKHVKTVNSFIRIDTVHQGVHEATYIGVIFEAALGFICYSFALVGYEGIKFSGLISEWRDSLNERN